LFHKQDNQGASPPETPLPSLSFEGRGLG